MEVVNLTIAHQQAQKVELAQTLEQLLTAVPNGKIESVFVEGPALTRSVPKGGEFDGRAYALECNGDLFVAPDGTQWAKLNADPAALPDKA